MPENARMAAAARRRKKPIRQAASEEIRRLRERGRIDLTFMLLTLLLLSLGLVMLLSASYVSAYYDTKTDLKPGNPTYYFLRQLFFSAIGVFAMYFISLIPLRWLRRFSFLSLLASAALLLGVRLVGLTGGGAQRWFELFGIRFQPSELVKVAVVLAFADWSCNLGSRMRTLRWGVLPFVTVMAIFAVLLIIQPHLSATVIVLCVGVMMMWAGGTRWFWIAGMLLAAWLMYRFILGNREFLLGVSDRFSYVYDRLDVWKDPEGQKLGNGWQVLQSLNAIGSGGLLGLGLGQSRQKYLYLPEEHNDYIFAVLCEELGFVGATLVLLLFAVLIIRGYWLALHCRDRFNKLMVVGLTSLLALQVFLNVGVVSNLLPSTGISLPFFSYGGTALLVQMAEIGMILSASRDISDK